MNYHSLQSIFADRQSMHDVREVVEHIIDHPYKMDELMDCFFHKEKMICQRASWPVTILAEKAPNLLVPYLHKMLLNLDSPHHDAVVRNTFRSFQFMDIPEDIEGMAFEKAFNFLVDIKNAIAIRVFAMTICANIAKKYPELRSELIAVIEENLPHGSAGFRSRGKKLLKILRSI